MYTCITILIYDHPREGIYLRISAYTAQIESLFNRDTLLPRQAYVFRIAVSSSKHQCIYAPASLRSQIDGASKDVQIFRRPSVWCRKRFSVALFPGKTFGGICICSLKWLIFGYLLLSSRALKHFIYPQSATATQSARVISPLSRL